VPGPLTKKFLILRGDNDSESHDAMLLSTVLQKNSIPDGRRSEIKVGKHVIMKI